MGFVTVLIQHSWAMQPAGAADIPDGQKATHGSDAKLSDNVRISVPSSVASFVKVFNMANSDALRRKCDNMALDILARLEHMVLTSCVTDNLRKDPMRGSLKSQEEMVVSVKPTKQQKPKKSDSETPTRDSGTSKSTEKDTVSRVKKRRYASQARRSVVALAKARSRYIRAKAMDLVLEALDTNELDVDEVEITNLLLLVTELVEFVESTIEGRKRRIRQAKLVGEEVGEDGEAKDVSYKEGTRKADGSIVLNVDEHLERLIMSIFLSLQRLEYAYEMKPFMIPIEIQHALKRFQECCHVSLSTDDPHVMFIISASSDTVEWLLSTRGDAEELMAAPVGLSLLSQLTRMMPPTDIVDMIEPFSGILKDLCDKHEWHLGRKFIKLLATAASFNLDACHMFLEVLKQIDTHCWQWYHLGILCLGVIVLTSKCSAVRKMALETGLLEYIDHGAKSEDPDNDISWKIRGVSAMVISEIYHQNKSDALGLLAYEALRERRKTEDHQYVHSQMSVSMPVQKPRRITYLFKYICTSLAESYSESQSRYHFLRKYLKTTDRRPSPAKKEPIKHSRPKIDPKLKTHPNIKVKHFWADKSEDKWDPSKLDTLLRSPTSSGDLRPATPPKVDTAERIISTAGSEDKVYEPLDLNQQNFEKFLKAKESEPKVDIFKVLGMNPLDHYKNVKLLSHFVTRMGHIKPRYETGLSLESQRKLTKAIKRAQNMGLMPVTYNVLNHGKSL
ncbi:hypothetical protein HDV05_006314 [Chytridiales sp. JEL 0842]|nr:hypothetical protein HDV05_006314 [Chytridiales sp. JEL 0842]